MFFGDSLSYVLGREYFHAASISAELHYQRPVGTGENAESYAVAVRAAFYLAMMKGKVPYESGFASRYLESYAASL